jgi:predicted enzyme related to lactoylglutathione lyase
MRTPLRAWPAAAACAATGLLFAAAATAADRYWPPIVDPPTGQHVPGRWVWADLVTTDVGRAAEFYGKVFGWTFETYGGADDRDTYTLVLADGVPVGGMVFDTRKESKDSGEPPPARWIGLVSVPDVAAAAKAAQAEGGRVLREPQTLGQRGETAVLADAAGALFGVVRSSSGDPLDYSAELNEWAWIDLWSPDVEKSAAFYRTVVGYDVRPVATNGENVARTGSLHLMSGGVLRAGIMPRGDGKTASAWLPYVRVADATLAVSRARAAGGRVLLEPTAVGAASVAIIVDPTGAPVGVVQLPAVEQRR